MYVLATQALVLILGTVLSSYLFGEEIEWSGRAGIEPRVFFDDATYDGQVGRGISPSAVMVPEVRTEWNEGADKLTVVGFLRYDRDDENRTHFDLREANWQHFAGPWSSLVGLGKVFWGVAESRHLVDIINQTDLVEDIDQEQKLGQPMVNVEYWGEYGTIGLFFMPGFRERTFPADDGRLRGPFPIADEDAVYESGAEDRRMDTALRWTNTIGNWDLGASAFYGTGREPRLVPRYQRLEGIELVPHYDVIGQIGVDAQYTWKSWLWKLEAIGRSGQGDDFGALVSGLEYTLFGIADSNVDIGLLVEYLYDDRDETAPPTTLEDDIFIGTRLGLNDPDDTSILVGSIIDLDDGESISIVEATRRIGEQWTLEAELRWFSNISETGQLSGFENDSYLTLSASWHY
jgi:hypothetical protein